VTGSTSTQVGLEGLLAEARALLEVVDETTAERLSRCVVRPLDESGLKAEAAQPKGRGTSPDERLLRLASALTKARVRPHAEAAVVEATAAAQDLAAHIEPGATAAFAKLQAKLPAAITVAPDGPYLATNLPELNDWLGVPVETRPQLALCRCGASSLMPLCDGSHRDVGFSGAKDPNRVPDRRDSYDGLQLTVLDNRGICAHSGFCTDRLNTVFHTDNEPFVTPSGGRLDEIIQAVRACPSGALSFALEEQELRDEVDQNRPPAVEISKDGPYRVTGGIPLLEPDGKPVARNDGASLEHYSLCRCGKSQNKPFCSGMHWYADFHDPPPPDQPTLFQWAGGFPALTRMTKIFYGKYVPEDPLLAPLFAEMSPDHPERVAAWLGEVFGGPRRYSEEYGNYDRMVSQHIGKAIREEQRARWVALLQRSADDAGLPADPEFRAAFMAYLEWGSRIAKENATVGAHPPPHLPVPRWWWVCDAYPDARVSALAPEPEDEAPVSLPGPDQPVSFATHIKPLFRARDRGAMQWAFDLWDHADVAKHAEPILARIKAGEMPCDGVWPSEWVDAFTRWIDQGKAD
jgi:CDGSH-type Zn-finger protein/truncated hemoglobin YjbI